MNTIRHFRSFEALSLIHKGITSAFKAANRPTKAEVENLRQAVEEIDKGLQLMKKNLAEAERELRNAEHLPPPRGVQAKNK